MFLIAQTRQAWEISSTTKELLKAEGKIAHPQYCMIELSSKLFNMGLELFCLPWVENTDTHYYTASHTAAYLREVSTSLFQGPRNGQNAK